MVNATTNAIKVKRITSSWREEGTLLSLPSTILPSPRFFHPFSFRSVVIHARWYKHVAPVVYFLRYIKPYILWDIVGGAERRTVVAYGAMASNDIGGKTRE